MLLLRGVNVGGKNRLPMKELTAIVAEAGGAEVRTYIQSGNVVCRTGDIAGLAGAVTRGIEARFGFVSPVIWRSEREWRAILQDNPFPSSENVHVMLLAETPAPGRTLDRERSPGDTFVLRGRDLYLHLPHGMGRTRLTNDWIDRSLGAVSTARNWRTLEALAALL